MSWHSSQHRKALPSPPAQCPGATPALPSSACLAHFLLRHCIPSVQLWECSAGPVRKRMSLIRFLPLPAPFPSSFHRTLDILEQLSVSVLSYFPYSFSSMVSRFSPPSAQLPSTDDFSLPQIQARISHLFCCHQITRSRQLAPLSFQHSELSRTFCSLRGPLPLQGSLFPLTSLPHWPSAVSLSGWSHDCDSPVTVALHAQRLVSSHLHNISDRMSPQHLKSSFYQTDIVFVLRSYFFLTCPFLVMGPACSRSPWLRSPRLSLTLLPYLSEYCP